MSRNFKSFHSVLLSSIWNKRNREIQARWSSNLPRYLLALPIPGVFTFVLVFSRFTVSGKWLSFSFSVSFLSCNEEIKWKPTGETVSFFFFFFYNFRFYFLGSSCQQPKTRNSKSTNSVDSLELFEILDFTHGARRTSYAFDTRPKRKMNFSRVERGRLEYTSAKRRNFGRPLAAN